MEDLNRSFHSTNMRSRADLHPDLWRQRFSHSSTEQSSLSEKAGSEMGYESSNDESNIIRSHFISPLKPRLGGCFFSREEKKSLQVIRSRNTMKIRMMTRYLKSSSTVIIHPNGHHPNVFLCDMSGRRSDPSPYSPHELRTSR